MIACPVGWLVSTATLFPRNVFVTHITGASAFIGLGGYVYYSGKQGLKERGHMIARQSGLGGLKWRLRGIALLSSTFVGMGLYRLVN